MLGDMVMELCRGLRAVSHSTREAVLSKVSSCHALEGVGFGTAIRVSSSDKSSVARMVARLQALPYDAVLGAGGDRVLLVLTKDTTLDGAPARCLFVNASRMVVAVRIAFDAALFDGDTILSGELVLASCTARGGNRTFLIQDLLVLQGKCLVGHIAPSVRLTWALDMIERGHVPDPAFDEVRLCVKRSCSTCDLGPLLEIAKHLPYRSTSLVLRPSYSDEQVFVVPIQQHRPGSSNNGTHPKLLSRVPRSTPYQSEAAESSGVTKVQARAGLMTARVMEVRRTDLPDVFEARLTGNSTTGGAWAPMCVPTLAASRHMTTAFRDVALAHTTRMMCTFDAAFGRWGPSLGSDVSFSRPEVAHAQVVHGSGSVRPSSISFSKDGCA